MYWRITSAGVPATGTFISIDKFTKFCSRLRTEHYMHIINVLEFISLYILNQSDLFLMIFAEWFWLIEWQCFNLSHIIFARTSFNSSCCDTPLHDFNNTLFWFWITHFFLSHPSDVLSGDIKLPLNGPPNKALPTSSENRFSKKLISFHCIFEWSGRIQYWSLNDNP